MSSQRWSSVHYWVRVVVRLLLAFVFLSYSVAKLVGTQFIDSGPTLDKPVGELSGFELTWVYFGYSKLFAWFVAGGQLTAAFLMLFDRTARLGAAVLLPIVANIVVVNFAFNISYDTKVVSVLYLALTLFLVAGDWRVWKRVLWDEPAVNPARPQWVRRPVFGAFKVGAFAAAGVLIGVGLNALQTSFVPVTPLTGDWVIESYTEDGKPAEQNPSQPQWRRVFFDGERVTVGTDRGHLHGRFKLSDGNAVEIGYDPEVPAPLSPDDEAAAKAQVEALTAEDVKRMMEADQNREWPVTIRGTYRRDGAKLILSGTRSGRQVELVLRPLVRIKW